MKGCSFSHIGHFDTNCSCESQMWANISPRKLPRWISERSYGAKLPNLGSPWLQFGLSWLQLGLQKVSKSRSGDIPRPSKHQKDRQEAPRPPNMEHFGTILDMIFQVFGTVSKIQGPAAEPSAFFKIYIYIYKYMYTWIYYFDIYIYTYIYIYMYICIYMYIYLYICIFVYLYIYVYMYICVCVYMYICTNMYMFLRMYVYMHDCIYAFMYTCV